LRIESRGGGCQRRAISRHYGKALERDPDSPFVHMEIALTHWHQRQYHQVLEWTTKTLALDPQHLLARELVASVHWKRGDFDRHLDEAIAHARSFGVPDEAFADLRRAHACGGRRAVVAYSIEQMSRHPQPAQHVQLALLRGELGEMDLAFGHLDAALDARDPSLVYLAAAPQRDHLRADVRFDARVARVGLSC
jgi:tetratricopeptide (TPR) repeat protein